MQTILKQTKRNRTLGWIQLKILMTKWHWLLEKKNEWITYIENEMRDYKCNCRKLMLTLCCSISEKVPLQHPSGRVWDIIVLMLVHSFAGVKEAAINWLKQDAFHSPKENVAELLRCVLAEGETLSSSIGCSLEWEKNQKKVKFPRTKIEFKKIKTPLSTVVVARNLHVMSSSIKKHHQKELVPVLY